MRPETLKLQREGIVNAFQDKVNNFQMYERTEELLHSKESNRVISIMKLSSQPLHRVKTMNWNPKQESSLLYVLVIELEYSEYTKNNKTRVKKANDSTKNRRCN